MVRLVSSTLATVVPNSRGKLSRTLIARAGLLDRWIADAKRVRDRTRPLVWFHAPSVGEGLQARPIIDALRRARPDVQIAYSFFSPSAESFAQSLDVDIANYLPFDSEAEADALIGALAPTALFFVKLDVWPKLVSAAKRNGVFVGLLSGTVAPSSGRLGKLSRALLHDAYAALDVVGAIDKTNGDRLTGLGVVNTRLTVSGDTRFDQVHKRAFNVDYNSVVLRSVQSARLTVVAGSTWPGDEAVLLPAWLEIRMRHPTARLIIAPHEPTTNHVTPIVEWANTNRLTVATLTDLIAPMTSVATTESTELTAPHSAETATSKSTHSAMSKADVVPPTAAFATPEITIVDHVGVLGDLYAIADVSFVGGAFHKAGLHSVLEPAAYGVPVIFGPRYAMSREASLLLECDGAVSVSSIADCAHNIGAWLADDSLRSRAGEQGKMFVESELGAAERSLQLVLGALV